MEFDNVIVKENPGLCRCCLSEGCYKELGTEYPWMDETEVYADMLLECFDISISQHGEGPNGTNRLICEVCITRLRDACNFKKQVLDCEKKFVDMIGRGEFKQKEAPSLKCELNLEETNNDGTEMEYLDDGMDFDNDKDETNDITVETLPMKSKRGRPRKNAPKPEKKTKEDKPRTSKNKGRHREKTIYNDIEEKLASMRHNVSQILLRSTLMPFRWLRTCFRCFFCYEMFDLVQDLKAHQISHSNDDIPKAINNYYENTVFVDISELACKMCSEIIDNLHQLIEHLITKHDLYVDNKTGHCMIPFNLNSQACVICQTSFKTYGNLVAHMSKKHKMIAEMFCKSCNVQFRDSKDICACVNGVNTLCLECNVGVDREELNDHMRVVHGKRYRCLACWEYFKTHYQRSVHLAVVHKRREFVKCLYCPKSFIFGSILKRHIREKHLKERNAICHVCGWKTFGQHELKAHLVKHASVKEHKCSVCEKMFKTKKSLRQHCVKCH